MTSNVQTTFAHLQVGFAPVTLRTGHATNPGLMLTENKIIGHKGGFKYIGFAEYYLAIKAYNDRDRLDYLIRKGIIHEPELFLQYEKMYGLLVEEYVSVHGGDDLLIKLDLLAESRGLA